MTAHIKRTIWEEEHDEYPDAPKEKTRSELVADYAAELMGDADWVHDTMVRFDLFKDIASSCLSNDDDNFWHIRRTIQQYAKRQAEDKV
jgi:hypothetical protein